MPANSTKRRKLSPEAARLLPYPDFPLSPHVATNRWYKVIKGRRFYFGPLDDPDAALEKYQAERDDHYAGRKPRQVSTGVTVADLVNGFLNAKQAMVDSGELKPRTWYDYYNVGQRVVDAFGRLRVVSDLRPEDFAALRQTMADSMGPIPLGNAIQRVRSIFKWGDDSDLLDRPVKFGPGFKKPSRLVVRKARRARGLRMFEADELAQILDAADTHLKAMILLGVNCGFGNSDVAMLPLDAIDFDNGVIAWPRPKTEIDRRATLWPETVKALRASLDKRPKHRQKEHAGLVFITKYGRPWMRDGVGTGEDGKPRRTHTDSVALQFGKLLKEQGLKRDGLNFYALRHTFQTIAEESRDFPAVERIMGHEDATRMATHYRERIEDARLKAVTDHVRAWLWPKPAKGTKKATTRQKAGKRARKAA